MKTSSFVLLLILISTGVSPAQERIRQKVRDVTIFASGCELTSESSVNLKSGTQEFIFEGIPATSDERSIQARGEGAFTILSVTKRQNYMQESDEFIPKEIKVLKDSLERLNDRLTLQSSMINILQKEEDLLMANKNIGGANVGVSIAELEKATTMFRNKLFEIQNKRIDTNHKVRKLSEQIVKVTKQLNELNNQRNNTSELVVTVESKAAGTGKIRLTYFSPQAGWETYYDVRAKDAESPVKIEQRARVWQTTGMDWDGVSLRLNSGTPQVDATKPTLTSWFVNISNPVVMSKRSYDVRGARTESLTMARPEVQSAAGEIAFKEEAKTAADYLEVSTQSVNTQFEIKIPYSISSDGKARIVEIQQFEIPATYRYYCAPRIDQDAFLLASITGWDKYNLLPGMATIFFENQLVNKSYLDVNSVKDTLDISMGRDKNVVVTRTLLKDFSEKQTVGSNKKISQMYEISVRNKRKQEILIEVQDQAPISSNEQLTVDILERSEGRLDAETGLITWNIKVPSSETKKWKFGFSLRFPKDKLLNNF